MFPQGLPGIGLLLLRLSVAGVFLLNAIRLGSSSSAIFRLGSVVIALISVCLSIGFLTPFLSIIACLAGLLNVMFGLNTAWVISLFAILNSAALLLLGPGGYSLDARLFGLRVTVVPPRKVRR